MSEALHGRSQINEDTVEPSLDCPILYHIHTCLNPLSKGESKHIITLD